MLAPRRSPEFYSNWAMLGVVIAFVIVGLIALWLRHAL